LQELPNFKCCRALWMCVGKCTAKRLVRDAFLYLSVHVCIFMRKVGRHNHEGLHRVTQKY